MNSYTPTFPQTEFPQVVFGERGREREKKISISKNSQFYLLCFHLHLNVFVTYILSTKFLIFFHYHFGIISSFHISFSKLMLLTSFNENSFFFLNFHSHDFDSSLHLFSTFHLFLVHYLRILTFGITYSYTNQSLKR